MNFMIMPVPNLMLTFDQNEMSVFVLKLIVFPVVKVIDVP
jgi:hypothetical protein